MDATNQPTNLPQAIEEIGRLRERLAAAEETIRKLLPELDDVEGRSVEEILADSTPWSSAIAEIEAEIAIDGGRE